MPLPKDFFAQPPESLARALLGKTLAHTLPEGQLLSGTIVETEAYHLTGDAAAHAARGPTKATSALFMEPGTLYIHPMRQYVGMDIVGLGGSVLLRALHPHPSHPQAGVPRTASGPGKLCRAMGITRALYGQNLTNPACPLKLEDAPPPSLTILATPRIGLTKNKEAPLRFILSGHPALSR